MEKRQIKKEMLKSAGYVAALVFSLGGIALAATGGGQGVVHNAWHTQQPVSRGAVIHSKITSYKNFSIGLY